MKIRTISISLSIMLLATLLVPVAVSSPVQAQSQTSWYVNDNPTLFGPQQFWFHGASGHGYGTNNYRYTYATGGDPSPNNWARWNMGSRVGQQEIQVYVPSSHATATVNYNVTIGGSTSKVRVAQNGTRGWYSLGNWNTNGANVVIAVYDNDAEHHHERNGQASSSIGVDAIRMRRSDLPPPGPDPPGPPLNLRLQVVAESDGSRTVVATWSPPSSDGGSAITGYQVTFSRPGRTFDTVDRSASSRRSTITGALANTTYTVRVRAENRVGLSSTVSASVRTPEPPNAGRPQPPRNLRLQVVTESDGSRTVVATWSPPSSDGGSAITGYKVRFSRPGRTFNTVDRTPTNRRSTITRALANTTYTVRVRAENRQGSGPEARNSVTTAPITGGPSAEPSPTGPQQGCANAQAALEDRFVPSVLADPARCEPVRLAYLNDNPTRSGRQALSGRDSQDGWKSHDPDDKPPFHDNGRPTGDWVFGRNGAWYTQRLTDAEQKATWEFTDVVRSQYDVYVFLPRFGEQEREQPGASVEYRIYEVDRGRLVRRASCRLDQGTQLGWTKVPNCRTTLEGQVRVYAGGTGARNGAIAPSAHRKVMAVDAMSLVPRSASSTRVPTFDYPYQVRKRIREAQDACAIDLGRNYNRWRRVLEALSDLSIDAFSVLGGAAIGALVGTAIFPGIGTAGGVLIGAGVGLFVSNATNVLKGFRGWIDSKVNPDEGERRVQVQKLCHLEEYWRNYYDFNRDQSGRAT